MQKADFLITRLIRAKSYENPSRSDKNWDVQQQKMARGYCTMYQNQGIDQLRGYHAAGLLLCFCIYAKSRFSYDVAHVKKEAQNLSYRNM